MARTVLYQTPESLIDGARMYAAAADAVNDSQSGAWYVTNHLLGMSIELSLKAYLQRRGYGDKALRQLGHNRKKLFDEAVERGLSSTGSRQFRILVHGQHYEKRLFAYPMIGEFGTIMPWSVRELAHGIIVEVFTDLRGEDALDASRNAPGLFIASTYERPGLKT